MKCDKCGENKPDVLQRAFVAQVLESRGFVRNDQVYDPFLCTACCSEMPGREWMKQGIPENAPVGAR